MRVKLPPGDLNPDPCPQHPTSIYTYGVTTTPRVCESLAKVLNSRFYKYHEALGLETTKSIHYINHIYCHIICMSF